MVESFGNRLWANLLLAALTALPLAGCVSRAPKPAAPPKADHSWVYDEEADRWDEVSNAEIARRERAARAEQEARWRRAGDPPLSVTVRSLMARARQLQGRQVAFRLNGPVRFRKSGTKQLKAMVNVYDDVLVTLLALNGDNPFHARAAREFHDEYGQTALVLSKADLERWSGGGSLAARGIVIRSGTTIYASSRTKQSGVYRSVTLQLLSLD